MYHMKAATGFLELVICLNKNYEDDWLSNIFNVEVPMFGESILNVPR
jgi:hypothetical protein